VPHDSKVVHLRAVYEELEAAEEAAPGSSDLLAGILRQLQYYVEGDRLQHEPEAQVTPDPASLETMRTHLWALAQETDDEEVRSGLEHACDKLDLVIERLDQSLRAQHDSPTPSE